MVFGRVSNDNFVALGSISYSHSQWFGRFHQSSVWRPTAFRFSSLWSVNNSTRWKILTWAKVFLWLFKSMYVIHSFIQDTLEQSYTIRQKVNCSGCQIGNIAFFGILFKSLAPFSNLRWYGININWMLNTSIHLFTSCWLEISIYAAIRANGSHERAR